MASVEVTPGAGTLVSFGGSLQLSATARNAAGTALSATFTWTSSNSSVATVDASGSVVAVSDGNSSITATALGVGSNLVTVTVAQAVGAVEVTPADVTIIAVGDAAVFAATTTDALGNVMDGQVFEWSSSNAFIATVDATGSATTHGAGSTSITATTAGISGSGQLVVDPVPVARLEMPESVGVGVQVSVDALLLTAGSGSVAGAFAFTVSFDPSVLQYNTATAADYVRLIFDNIVGSVRMVASAPTGMAGSVTVATLVFDVVGGAGSSTDLEVSIDTLIEALTFNDLTANGVGETRSLMIQ